MKKLGIFSYFFLVAIVGFSQSSGNLQGPKAKNTKPWMAKSEITKVVFSDKKVLVKGPKAKNTKPSQSKKMSFTERDVITRNQNNLKGPKAKNTKPWQPITNKTTGNLVSKNQQKRKIKQAR